MGEKLTRTGWINLGITIILLGAIGVVLLGCLPGQKDPKNTGVRHIETEWQSTSYHCISWKHGSGAGLWCEKETRDD